MSERRTSFRTTHKNVIESFARNTYIHDVNIKWDYPYQGQGDVFHLTGNSSGTLIDNVTINNVGPVNVADSGGTVADYHFGKLIVSGKISHLLLERVDELHNGDRPINGNFISMPAISIREKPSHSPAGMNHSHRHGDQEKAKRCQANGD